jgi:predicted glutamine amidotransferase
MCRLYAQISSSPRAASDYLAESDRSLLRQANFRKKDYQQDGWGFGYFNGAGAQVVKSPKAAFAEAARFKRLAGKIKSKVVIGHLRAASNPMNLSKKELMRADNAQPFTDGRFVFAHNGTVLIPKEVLKFLGPYKARMKGSNDSEIYFWQFIKFYDMYGSIPEALKACVRELWTLRDYKPAPPKAKWKLPYLGLNTLVSDGKSLHALCHFPQKHPKISLFNPKQQWGRMAYARRGDRVVLASEELDKGGWGHFGNPEIVSATLSGGKVKVTRQTFTPGPA